MLGGTWAAGGEIKLGAFNFRITTVEEWGAGMGEELGTGVVLVLELGGEGVVLVLVVVAKVVVGAAVVEGEGVVLGGPVRWGAIKLVSTPSPTGGASSASRPTLSRLKWRVAAACSSRTVRWSSRWSAARPPLP